MLRANDDCWCGSGKKYKRCHRALLIRPGHVGPLRSVPAEIAAPDYVGTGRPVKSTEAAVKSADVIERMRAAGKIARDVLAESGEAVAVGVTTDEIDRIAHEAHLARGVYPSPLGYHDFPKSVCTSVNEVICHGIPDDRPLRDGDLVNVDVTVFVDGVHGDTNATFGAGTLDPESAAPRARDARVPGAGDRGGSPRSACCSTSGAPSSPTRRATGSGSCAPSSATASARCSTGRPRCPTTTSRRRAYASSRG